MQEVKRECAEPEGHEERRNKAVLGQSTLWNVIFYTCDY